jgi:ketosteroid isomerase-like protein
VPAEAPPGDPRENALERAAAAAVRDYVDALDAGDAERVCALLAPGVLDLVELPQPRGDCAASLAASIGYRDPRGLPVWEGARAAGIEVAELTRDGTSAKVVATVVTTFADREEASVEDDIVYLERQGARWLIAKPSSTLYRAVGISDIPLTVLSPPSG